MMTEEERGWIRETWPPVGKPSKRSPEELLSLFGAHDGQALGNRLVAEAMRDRDRVGLELALGVCEKFGLDRGLVPALVALAFEDWHHRHEVVALFLEELAAPESVEALVHSVRHHPPYLDHDDGQALARKAIYALGKIPGDEAERALLGFLDADRDVVRAWARRTIDLRHDQSV